MAATTGHDVGRNVAPRSTGARRLVTETKSALKTTELWVYVAATIAVLVAAMVVDETDAGGFGAKQAWLYVTILTVGYLLSRGLAKSGSREPYSSDDSPSELLVGCLVAAMGPTEVELLRRGAVSLGTGWVRRSGHLADLSLVERCDLVRYRRSYRSTRVARPCWSGTAAAGNSSRSDNCWSRG